MNEPHGMAQNKFRNKIMLYNSDSLESKKKKIFSLQKSVTEAGRARHLISISQHSIILKVLLVILSGVSSCVCPCLFATVFGEPFGIAGASISLVFLESNGILLMYLKTMERKKV